MARSSLDRSRSGRSKQPMQFGPLQYAIIGLTIITALIHFVIAFDYMFILNGLGYLGLLGALYLPVPLLAPYRWIVRWVLIGYTLLTVILWAVITGGSYSLPAYFTKAVEVALIGCLWVEGQQDRQSVEK